MSDIREKVVAIIVDKLNVEESEVANEASFTNDLGADSLDTVELIMELKSNSISLFQMTKQKEFKQLVMQLITLLKTQNSTIHF